MSRVATLMAFLMIAAAFSGCVLEGDAELNSRQIVKKVLFEAGENVADAETLEDLLHVTYEYTHQGDAVPAADVTATYLDVTGRDATKPLSTFTTAATLQSGDLVRIQPVNLTSGLKLEYAGNVLAARDGLQTDWLRAQGYPIPLASSRTGTATWSYEADSSLRVDAAEFTLDDENATYVESVHANWSVGLDGTLGATTSLPAEGPRIDLDARLRGDVGLEAELVTLEDGATVESGIDAEFYAWLNGTAVLKFDASRNLKAVGAQGSAYADGNIHAWDGDHPRETEWFPEEFEHPLLDESSDYEEEVVEFDPEDVDATIAEFLARLWSTRIGVGDEYRFVASFGGAEDDLEVRVELVIQVTGLEERATTGGTFEAFRIAETFSVFTRGPTSGGQDFELALYTIWVHADSYLPVYEQGSFARSFDRDDIEDLFEEYGGELPVTLPQDLAFVIEARSALQLASYEGDLSTAPVMSLLGWSAGGSGLLGAGAAFSLLGMDLGDDDTYDLGAAEAAPSVSFTADEALDRLVVASAAEGADWDRLQARVASCTQAEGSLAMGRAGNYSASYNVPASSYGTGLNVPADTGTACGEGLESWLSFGLDPVAAGDYVSFCSSPPEADMRSIQVEVVDDYANELLFSHTFETWADCPDEAL